MAHDSGGAGAVPVTLPDGGRAAAARARAGMWYRVQMARPLPAAATTCSA